MEKRKHSNLSSSSGEIKPALDKSKPASSKTPQPLDVARARLKKQEKLDKTIDEKISEMQPKNVKRSRMAQLREVLRLKPRETMSERVSKEFEQYKSTMKDIKKYINQDYIPDEIRKELIDTTFSLMKNFEKYSDQARDRSKGKQSREEGKEGMKEFNKRLQDMSKDLLMWKHIDDKLQQAKNNNALASTTNDPIPSLEQSAAKEVLNDLKQAHTRVLKVLSDSSLNEKYFQSAYEELKKVYEQFRTLDKSLDQMREVNQYYAYFTPTEATSQTKELADKTIKIVRQAYQSFLVLHQKEDLHWPLRSKPIRDSITENAYQQFQEACGRFKTLCDASHASGRVEKAHRQILKKATDGETTEGVTHVKEVADTLQDTTQKALHEFLERCEQPHASKESLQDTLNRLQDAHGKLRTLKDALPTWIESNKILLPFKNYAQSQAAHREATEGATLLKKAVDTLENTAQESFREILERCQPSHDSKKDLQGALKRLQDAHGKLRALNEALKFGRTLKQFNEESAKSLATHREATKEATLLKKAVDTLKDTARNALQTILECCQQPQDSKKYLLQVSHEQLQDAHNKLYALRKSSDTYRQVHKDYAQFQAAHRETTDENTRRANQLADTLANFARDAYNKVQDSCQPSHDEPLLQEHLQDLQEARGKLHTLCKASDTYRQVHEIHAQFQAVQSEATEEDTHAYQLANTFADTARAAYNKVLNCCQPQDGKPLLQEHLHNAHKQLQDAYNNFGILIRFQTHLNYQKKLNVSNDQITTKIIKQNFWQK